VAIVVAVVAVVAHHLMVQRSRGSDPYPSVGLNGSLSGRVFETGNASYLDLSTGETVQLAGDSAHPSRNGLEIVELHDDVRFLINGCSYFNDRIIIRDALTGFPNVVLELPDSVDGPVKLAPDGQSMALYWKDSENCLSGSSIAVFSRNGEAIIQGIDEISSFDWLPDNRLVYTFGQKLVAEIECNTFRSRTIADMSSIEGIPGRVAVSPDDSQVLFEMITDASSFLSTVSSRDSTVWGVNIDGSHLRRFATTSRVDDSGSTIDDPRVNMPVWSPDSQTVLVTEDYISGGIISIDDAFVVTEFMPVSNAGLTYAVPASTQEQLLPPMSYSANGVRSIVDTTVAGEFEATAVEPFSSTLWAPAMTRAPVISGGLPTFNSHVNRGLNGRLFFLNGSSDSYDEPDIAVLDLASGAQGVHTDLNDDQISFTSTYSAISADAQLSAHHIYEAVREHYLRVYDAAGRQLHSISLVTDSYTYKPESAFRFSPVNSKHVAWVYDDDDYGTGAVVIDLSTKRFVGLDYDGIAWTREGDLLLIDAGRVYRSRSRPSDGLFGNGELLSDFVEPIEHPDVSPANNDIAFQAGGQIFAIRLNGNNARRMVAYSDEPVDYPSWSPDG